MKALVVTVFLLFSLVAYGQDSISRSQGLTTLKGYFVTYRDTMVDTDPDYIVGQYSFIEYFVPDSATLINPLDFDSVTLKRKAILISNAVSGAVQKSDIEREAVSKIIEKRKTDWEDANYNPFDFDPVPLELINSRLKFLCVFKGELEVWGKIECNHPYTNDVRMDGYVYLKSVANKMKYLYSIVLPGTTSFGLTYPTGNMRGAGSIGDK